MKNWTYILIAYLLIGNHSFYLYSQNQSVADSLIRNLENSKNLSDSVKYFLNRNISKFSSKPSQKLFYGKESLKIANRVNSPIWAASSSIYVGRAYMMQGDLTESLKNFIKGAENYKLAKNSIGLASAYNSIANVYRRQENYNQSIANFNKSIEIFREARDTIRLAATLLNIGELYRDRKKLDSAFFFFNESKTLYKKLNYDIGVAYNLGNIGLVYAEKGQIILAEDNINNASKILEELGDRYPIAVYSTYMADIYNEKGDFKRALEYAKNSLKIGVEEGLKEQIRDASLKLSELYQSTRDFERAYNYQSQYIAYRDSINNEETIRKMADLQTEFEVGQKQIELDLVEAQQAAERERSYIIGASMAAVLLLIGIFAYIQSRNIRQRKKVNQQLALQKQELEQLNQTKDRFFSIISHDLRGPVNAFAGISKLIKMYLKKGKVEEINEMAGDIDESAGRLSNLLDNLLEWAVQQQGQFPYTPEKVNFKRITKELIDTFETTASGKEIHLHSKIDTDIFLFIDKNSTTTIFRNLVGNALKFTPEGGEVFFDAKIQGDSVLLSVNDTGVGIPKEKFDQLFTLSETKSTWGTSGEKGLGLGLQLAYEFTEMNKGKITVESTEGEGTSFIVELPLFDEVIKKNEVTIA